jgi:putative transposase
MLCMFCRATGFDPKTVRRDRPPDDPEIRKEMNMIAETPRRFGDPLAGNGVPANHVRRRIGVMLERMGMIMNETKLCPLADMRLASNAVRRIYREEGRSVRRRRGRKRARGSRTPPFTVCRQTVKRQRGKPQQNGYIESFNGGLRPSRR